MVRNDRLSAKLANYRKESRQRARHLPREHVGHPFGLTRHDSTAARFYGSVAIQNGTLAEGTARGDGSAEILKGHYFRWSRNLGCWYLPHSRDRAADRVTLNALCVAAPGRHPRPRHPWEGVRFSATWGSRDVLDTTLVHPDLVAEVSADRAIDHGGIYRHPLRFQRLRLDVGLEDVPGFGEGPTVAG
ncbi:hypothetical protein [Streptomyces sp. NPDC056491]|uniref:hypothetical protein n=1 Tax=Streptomyces sp. NPDC056491 TaxID=3345837 RepID=UPI0036AC3441